MKHSRNDQQQLNMQEASQLLKNVFEECGAEPNSVPMEALSAYTVYRRERFHLQRGVIAAVLLLFFLLPFLFIQAKFTVSADESGERKLPVYTVRVTSPLPVYSVRATQKSHSLPVYEADARTFTVEPTRNGTMDIRVALVNRQETKETINVTGVDARCPEFLSSSIEDKMVYLYVRDEGIGVAYNDVYAVSSGGEMIKPERTDKEQGLIVFLYPETSCDVYIPDHIGNTLHLAMKLE